MRGRASEIASQNYPVGCYRYNERPHWLTLAHERLDRAVFDAYGWPRDLSDDAILERLLALNLERAGTAG